VEGEELSESELRSGSSRGRFPKCGVVMSVGVRKMGYPGAEVARFLGVSTSAVVRAPIPRIA